MAATLIESKSAGAGDAVRIAEHQEEDVDGECGNFGEKRLKDGKPHRAFRRRAAFGWGGPMLEIHGWTRFRNHGCRERALGTAAHVMETGVSPDIRPESVVAASMIVCSYLQTAHIPQPTGVGKHLINMTEELAKLPDTQVRLLAAEREYRECRASGCRWPFGDAALTLLPGRRRIWEGMWRAIGLPHADGWCRGADWIYSPTEVFIPTRSIPVAVTIHCVHWFEKDYPAYGTDAYRRARVRWSTILRPALKRSRLVLVVSDYLGSRVRDIFNVPASRIAVVGNGVEETFFFAASAAPVDVLPNANVPYVISIGGLTTRKGAEYVLSAAQALNRAGSPLRVVVVGQSEPFYEAQARSHANVVLLPYAGLDRLPSLVAGARALVCLSRHETFGIPIAEAMAAGTPVVASRFAAIPEIVGDAGILVDVTVPDDVAHALVEFDRNESLRTEYARKGRQRAESMRWSACAQRLRAALRDAA